MVTILPPVERKPTFGQRLSQGVGRGLEIGNQLMQQHQQKEQTKKLSELTGIDLAGVNPETQQSILKLVLEGRQGLSEQNNRFEHETNLQNQKYSFEEQLMKNKPLSQADLKAQKDSEETYNSLKGAQDSLNRMKSLRKKGNLGRGSAARGIFGGETAKNRGEYEQLGKSLIQYATNIPIRNRIEFETLAEKLYDPSIPDKEAEGILSAIERILNNSLKGFSEQGNQTSKRPLSNFAR